MYSHRLQVCFNRSVETFISSNVSSTASFVLTILPAKTEYLQETVDQVDYVNVQIYASGIDLDMSNFTTFGIRADQPIYGLCAETGCTSHSVEEVEAACKQNRLA